MKSGRAGSSCTAHHDDDTGGIDVKDYSAYERGTLYGGVLIAVMFGVMWVIGALMGWC